MNRLLKICAGVALAAASIPSGVAVLAHEINGNAATAASYVDAYNARDIDAMSALMHTEIQWIAIEGGKSEVVADGRTALVEQMTSYLSSPSVTRSSYSDVIENGRFLTMRETAQWKDAAGKDQAQSAIAVYEFEDGLVRRVWYYPAQK
jgi:hypothetical protein